MARRKQTEKAGVMTSEDIRKLINQQAGYEVAYDLTKNNPTDVKEWIPTNSKWLDSIIVSGKMGGIPVGKITELAGLESTGKSYMAAQIAANAQKAGYKIIYFDSEGALSSEFLERSGVKVGGDTGLNYIPVESVEQVFKIIDMLLKQTSDKLMFVWDSLAMTPTEKQSDSEDFNPQQFVALKPRVLSEGFQKLTVPLLMGGHIFLVLNQLYTNIPSSPAEAMLVKSEPYKASGGVKPAYAYSLRLWLSRRKAKSAMVQDEDEIRIGNEIKVLVKKNRFGCEGRHCHFNILWGKGDVRIQDEESWFDAIEKSPRLTSPSQGWFAIEQTNGVIVKFRRSAFVEKLEDPLFREAVDEIMFEELIEKYQGVDSVTPEYFEPSPKKEAKAKK